MLTEVMTSLVEMSLEVACQSKESVRSWRNQRRTLEKLPTHLAESLLRRLLANHLLSPPLLEGFQFTVERVDFSGQTIVDAEWLAYVGGFGSLRFLDVSDCKLLTDAAIWHVSGLEHVEELRIDRCRRITNEGLEHILSLKRLKRLGISETGIRREGLSKLSVLTNLTHLDLGGLPVSDDDLSSMQVLQELVQIDLWGTGVSNKGVRYLQALPKLERISLAWTSVSIVPSLPRLSYLDLCHCNVHSIFFESGLCLQQLFLSRATLREQLHILSSSLLSGLLILELSGTNITTYSFLSSMRRIVRLDLSSTAVSDDSMNFLAESGAHLKWLDLSHTKISSLGIGALIGHVPVLEHMSLKETMVDDNVFGYLSTITSLVDINVSKTNVTGILPGEPVSWSVLHLQSLPNLRRLDLCQTRFTDKSCKRLGTLVQLKHLLLSAEFLTDKSLHALAVLSSLESLSFQGTVLTDAGLRSFHPPASLQELDLRDCWLLSRDSLFQFSETYRNITVKHELHNAEVRPTSLADRHLKLTQSPAKSLLANCRMMNQRDERIRYTASELLELRPRVSPKINFLFEDELSEQYLPVLYITTRARV